jgi:hypothetical protein
MNLTSLFASSTPALLRRSAGLLLGLLVAVACSDDEEAPAPQPDFTVAVANIDGKAPDDVTLPCSGQLAVAVDITTSIDPIRFTLRPRHACGSSKRCGYVRVEGLDENEQALTQVETVTTTGLLQVDAASREQLRKVRVTLISGVDQKPIVNADGSEVSQVVDLTVTLATDCPVDAGMGGAGGAAAGGAGGVDALGGASGADALGGAGGAVGGGSSDAGAGGATGESGGAGGEPTAAGGAGAGS